MASQTMPRLVVWSTVSGLANHVQKLLPAVTVQDVQHDSAADIETCLQSPEVKRPVGEAEVMLGDLDILRSCIQQQAIPNLKWAQSTWAGVNVLTTLASIKENPVKFTLTRTCGFSDDMAEYVIGHIIAYEKNFDAARIQQEQKIWNKSPFKQFRPLSTLTIGILGYGTIGKRVAAACKAFGMTVWAVNRTKQNSPSSCVDQFRGLGSLGEVLENCDYICSILPSTPQTNGLLSGQVLEQCQKKKSMLINIGRGNVIDEESIVEAVSKGWIRGAILDVFPKEPLPVTSPLWSLPNVVVTPHVAGPSFAGPVAKSFAENFNLYVSGKPLQNVVDWEAGY